jgi:hypothetical protein
LKNTTLKYRLFRAQADWTFILLLEITSKALRHLPRKIPPRRNANSKN